MITAKVQNKAFTPSKSGVDVAFPNNIVFSIFAGNMDYSDLHVTKQAIKALSVVHPAITDIGKTKTT